MQAILLGNWRGQTTTMPAEPGKGNEEGGSILSTITSCVTPRHTPPVVILHKERDIQHIRVRHRGHRARLVLS